jgi:hypothetical protein
MWHTPEGDRVLTGNEAKLFLASLRFMADILEDDDHEDAWSFRVEVFDRLTLGQKLTMLRDVARALLDPTESMPELSAVNEGTVAAVYQNLLDNTLMEVDEDEEPQTKVQFGGKQPLTEKAAFVARDTKAAEKRRVPLAITACRVWECHSRY